MSVEKQSLGPQAQKPRPTRVGFSRKTLRPETRYKVTHVTRSTRRPNYTHVKDLQDLDKPHVQLRTKRTKYKRIKIKLQEIKD